MEERDKLLHKYCKSADKHAASSQIIYDQLTKMKGGSRIGYYHKYFEENKNNLSKIWKGIRSIINIDKSSRRDNKLLNDNGNTIFDHKKLLSNLANTL